MKKLISAILILAAAALAATAQQPEVSPNPAEVMLKGTVQFSVPGQEQAAIRWQVLPPSLGTIDPDGLFTAGTSAGQGIVRANVSDGDKRLLGHALIKIVGGKTTGLTVKIHPAPARLEPGKTLAFAARVSHLNGDPANNAVISWQVVPAGLGTIDRNGYFTALNPGTGRIVALAKYDRFQGLGQTKMTVESKQPLHKLLVEMTPIKANLKPGDNAEFSATVTDRKGNPVAARLEYQVEPSNLGTIDGSGNFTAGKKPGLGIIKILAKHENGSGTAKSMVVVEDNVQRYTVKLKPRQSALEPGQSLEFTAEAFDKSGNQVTPPYWDWKVIPEKLGEISPQGIFTAGQKPGQGKVVASLPPQFGLGQSAASIRIRPGQPLRVKVDPPNALLLPGQPQQFTAEVLNDQGQPLPQVKILWKISPEGLGTINQNGLFRAGDQPGRKGTVLAVVSPQQGGGQGAALVSISQYKIRIDNPGPIELGPGESCSFTATVTDAMGNPAAAGPLEWTTDPYSQQFGTITPTGMFTAGHPANQIAGWVIVRVKVGSTVIADRIAVVVKNN